MTTTTAKSKSREARWENVNDLYEAHSTISKLRDAITAKGGKPPELPMGINTRNLSAHADELEDQLASLGGSVATSTSPTATSTALAILPPSAAPKAPGQNLTFPQLVAGLVKMGSKQVEAVKVAITLAPAEHQKWVTSGGGKI